MLENSNNNNNNNDKIKQDREIWIKRDYQVKQFL